MRLNAIVFGWSWHAFSIRGIAVKIHFLLLLFTAFRLLGALSPEEGISLGLSMTSTLSLLGILWGSVFLHEWGHVGAAYSVGGSATHILMWPLGGLAYCDAPNTPGKQAIVAAGGPAVNVVIAGLAALGLLALGVSWSTYWHWMLVPYYDEPVLFTVLKLNLIMIFFNVIPAFPMDGGRLFMCAMWPKLGYRRAMFVAVRLAQVTAVGLGILGLWQGELLLLGIAIFVFFSATHEWRLVEAGVRQDESLFGYDFSQGYTSLGMSQPEPAGSRPGFFTRWRDRRRRRRERREREALVERRRRVDELLEKIHTEGLHSLTPKERAFLEDASKDYRS